jgi:3-dehydroquinate synthase
MHKKRIAFPSQSVDFYFNGRVQELKKMLDVRRCVVITDEHVFEAHAKKLKDFACIVLHAGEAYKVQQTVDAVIDELIDMGADRQTVLIGIGGGVVTDITGYIASIYQRGIAFALVPTTILAMVDAAIGGKNGIDVGIYKNQVGCIKQPEFILYDFSFLSTLPEAEWISGFAEIIKHAAIADAAMFAWLEEKSLSYFQRHRKPLAELIERNALLKASIVRKDEREQGVRKWLNFGHTLGHALENVYELSHGQAISIGMTYAAHIAAKHTKFKSTTTLIALLSQYHLPTYAHFDVDKAVSVMLKDKKKTGDMMQLVLLTRIGKATIHAVPVTELIRYYTLA